MLYITNSENKVTSTLAHSSRSFPQQRLSRVKQDVRLITGKLIFPRKKTVVFGDSGVVEAVPLAVEGVAASGCVVPVVELPSVLDDSAQLVAGLLLGSSNQVLVHLQNLRYSYVVVDFNPLFLNVVLESLEVHNQDIGETNELHLLVTAVASCLNIGATFAVFTLVPVELLPSRKSLYHRD